MKKKQIANQEVIWEAQSFSDDWKHAQTGGVFDLSAWECVEISGPDARDYLHRMSTLDFRNFPVGKVAAGAFLTGKAVPVIWGYFLKTLENTFQFLVPPGQGALAYEHIEKFHFAENLTVTETSQNWKVFGLWLPARAEFSAIKLPSVIGVAELVEGTWLWKDPFRASLTWCLVPTAAQPTFLEKIKTLPALGYRLFEFLRIDAGLVWVGVETTEKTLALEAGMDGSISPQKGCYPGQEVVERIHTYGRVNRRLARVEITGGDLPSLPLELLAADGRPAGTLIAAETLPDDPSRAYGMAYIHRAFLDQPDGQPFVSASDATKLQARLR